MNEWEQIINEYLKWIKDNTTLKTVSAENTINVVTPFLDRHNDHINLYVKKLGNNYFLTDDGYTLNDLIMTGFELNTDKRKLIFNTILRGFGVKVNENDELYVESTMNEIGQKKHSLIQAIIAVNDLHALSAENVQVLFKEDIELFFITNNIFHVKDVKLTGKSGFDHNIDFVISATKDKPEKIIKTINILKKDNVIQALFSLNDVREFREANEPKGVVPYVIFNDSNKEPSTDDLRAFQNYNVGNLAWSKKESIIESFRQF